MVNYKVILCLRAGDIFEEEAGNNGTEALRYPVENAGQDSDVPADGQPKGDCRVEVAAKDTPTNRANAWATATAMRPAGSKAAPEVSLSENNPNRYGNGPSLAA